MRRWQFRNTRAGELEVREITLYNKLSAKENIFALGVAHSKRKELWF